MRTRGMEGERRGIEGRRKEERKEGGRGRKEGREGGRKEGRKIHEFLGSFFNPTTFPSSLHLFLL
jgi:hypothetical protein